MRTGLTPREALKTILELSPSMPEQTVPCRDALGRVLIENVDSTRQLPPADNSAMDGFAVRVADLAGASEEQPVDLPVRFEVAAGARSEVSVGPGEAARIFTGAPIPAGADTVVRQEDTFREGDRVSIRVAPRLGEHVRLAGEDVQIGDRVLAAGTVLGPSQIGMLASLGRSVVAVHQRPQVAILSSGDELVEPDGDISGGRIVSSNSYSLAEQSREVGAEPVYLGIADDSPADLERRFRAGLGADVLVSSAGVSVGDRDFVRDVIAKLGAEMIFWGVKMKPGYPLAFGHFPDGNGPLLFGLPGNPVSAMMTFEQFVRPALLKMAGHTALFRRRIQARLVEPLRKRPGRLEFVRVQLELSGDDVLAHCTGNQSSGVLRSMSLAHGLVLFAAESSELSAGSSVTVQVLDERPFSPDGPGF